MKNKVYVAAGFIGYEGHDVLAVYSTLEKAKKHPIAHYDAIYIYEAEPDGKMKQVAKVGEEVASK